MIDLGHFILVAAWIMSVYALIVGTKGALAKRASVVRSAAHAVLLCGVLSAFALLALIHAFVTHEYRYLYVWQNSNNDMPRQYLVSAVWGGMDGSMLLWATFMAVLSAVVVARRDSAPRELANWLAPILGGATSFFLLVVVFLTNPFRLIPGGNIPPDGNGLNPLLQNPSMLIHPPMLYAGFTGFVVPFAFCFAALLSGNLGEQWIRLTRRWTLLAWGFLTCGIILGGNWAYIELGWGGFWAWDPVENASFLPWLTGTAFLHSVMVQERKGMLKVWNASLSILTYVLSVFGTFLTRSGVVQSVHAFAETDVGWVFLAYIGVVSAFAVGLIAYRFADLRPERKLESYLSREAAFLFNNLALLGICFATFWGVMFPIISEKIAGEKSVVGPPFFNRVNVPLFLFLIFLMGVGPLIAWRRASLKSLKQTFLFPMLVGSVVTAFFLWLEPSKYLAALAFGLSMFVVMTIEGEIRRAVRARRELRGEGAVQGAYALMRRRPRRYGGFLVHLGICVMAVSITASMAYKVERDISLKSGEKATVGRYTLKLESLKQQDFPNYTALISEVSVSLDDGATRIATLHPERRLYRRNQEATTEVDIRMTPRDDLYLALAGIEAPEGSGESGKETALFKVFVNPLQMWLWVGALVVLSGTGILLVAGLFARSEETVPVAAIQEARS